MKECLDKPGLQYFYEKLCKIFLRKDQQAVFVLTSQGIEEALGYSPVSDRLYSTDISSLKKNMIQFSNDLKKVTSITNSTGIAIDTLKAEIAQWADQIDTVNGEVTSITRKISAQSGKIQDIASKYSQLDDKLTAAENTIDVNEGYIKSALSQIKENRESITKIKQWIDENQSGFDISAEIKKGTDQAKAEIMGIVFEDPNDPTKLNSKIKISADDIQIDGQNIDLSGNVTFKGLESSVDGVNGKVDELNSKLFGETTITGGLIKTELINTEELKVKHLDGATGSFSGQLTASDISASTINGGTITGQITGTGSINTSGTFTGDIVARSITLGDNGTTYNSWDSLKSDVNITDEQIENVISNKFNENVVTVNKLASAINNLSYSELTTIGNGVTAALTDYATTSNLTKLREDLTNLLSGKVDNDKINGIVDEIVQNRNNELIIPTVTRDSDGIIHISVNGVEYNAYEKTTSDGKYVVYGTNGSQDESGTYFVLQKDGLLKANNAIINGVIVATDGHFTGKVDAASGTIGGWKISEQAVDGTQLGCLVSDYDATDKNNPLSSSNGTLKLVSGRGLYINKNYLSGSDHTTKTYLTNLDVSGLTTDKAWEFEGHEFHYGVILNGDKFESYKTELDPYNEPAKKTIIAQFNNDGSGKLANGGISWDTNGSLSVKNASIQSGTIGGWTIQSNKIQSTSNAAAELWSCNIDPKIGIEFDGNNEVFGSATHITNNVRLNKSGLNIENSTYADNGNKDDLYCKLNTDGFEITHTLNNNSTTITDAYISNGTGQFANGNFSWDDDSNITLDASKMPRGFKINCGNDEISIGNDNVTFTDPTGSSNGLTTITKESLAINPEEGSNIKLNGDGVTVGDDHIYSKLGQNQLTVNSTNAGNGYQYKITGTDSGWLNITQQQVQGDQTTGRSNNLLSVGKDFGFFSGNTFSWDATRPNISFMSGKITLNNSQNRPTILFNDSLYTCLYYDGTGDDKNFVMNNGSCAVQLKSLSTSKSNIAIHAGENTGITIDETTNSITSTSNITTASDINIKDIISEDTCFTVDNIADAPFFDYTYKNDESKNVQIGTSAQYWQTVCPNSVKADENGILGLNYQGVALGSAICLAKKIKEQQSEIDELKSQIAELKTLINNK